jgi:hypothetical protein
MRIPVGTPAHHHLMPVEHGRQLQPSRRRQLTMQDSHFRHPFSMYTIPPLKQRVYAMIAPRIAPEEYFDSKVTKIKLEARIPGN